MSRERVAIYTRVSTDEQVDNTSLSSQEAECRHRCEAEGWVVREVFEDAGVSGALPEPLRPAFHRMMNACRSGEVDRVVCVDPDRFTRDSYHGEGARRDLVALNVDLVFTRTGRIDAFEFGYRGLFAQQEREKIRERTMRGLEAVVAKGYWPGGPAPYGFKTSPSPDGRHTLLTIDEDEAAMLRAAMSMVIDERMTTGQAANALDRLGWTQRNGAPWHHRNLRRVLLDTAWTGEWEYRGSRGGRSASGLPVTVPVPPLASVDRAALLRQALASTSTSRSKPVRYLLSRGRLISPCGQHFSGVVRSDGTTRQYLCTGTSTRQGSRCGCNRVNADLVEHAAWQAISDLLNSPDRLRSLASDFVAKQGAAVRQESSQIDSFERKVRVLDDLIRVGTVKYIKAGAEPEDLVAAMATLRNERAAIVVRLEQLRSWERDSKALSDRVDNLAKLATNAEQRLSEMTPQERLAVIELLDLRVTVTSWALCSLCLGKGKVKGGRGGTPCPTCRSMRRIPTLLIEGTLLDRLADLVSTPSDAQVVSRRHLVGVPFSVSA